MGRSMLDRSLVLCAELVSCRLKREAFGMSVWRFFNIGKYKNQKVKDVCYFNPFYVAWCLESWQGFSLTSYERSNYMKGLERQLEKDPEDQELILKVSKCKTIV